MKTKKGYLKIGLLLSLLITMVLSCTNDNLELSQNNQIQQKQKNSIRKVTIKDVPSVEKYLKLNISSKQKSSRNSSYAVTPFGNIPLDNITEVLDTLGNANYTFPIIPSNLQKDKFFNLVIYQNTIQGTSNSYVVEYKMKSDFATDYANGTKDFNQFTGKIKKYNTNTFLANPPTPTPCDEDDDGDDGDDLPPCLEIVIVDGDDYDDVGDPPSGDGTTNSGSNNNSGSNGDNSNNGANTGTGTTSGGSTVVCWTELVAEVCNGGGGHYGSASCTGSFHGSILLVTTCSDGYVNVVDISDKTSNCDDGSGDVAVIPTIFSEFDTIILGLDENEKECLNQNCDLKNDLYQYLNSNVDSNGNYEQDAIDFVQYVTSFIDSSCSFNGDFEALLSFPIIDLQSLGTCNDKLVKRTFVTKEFLEDTDFGQKILNSFISNSNSHIAIKSVTNLPSTTAAKTKYNRIHNPINPVTGDIMIHGDVINIELNINLLNQASDIKIVTTLFHELLHAYIIYLYHEDLLLSTYPQYSELNTALINHFANPNNIFVENLLNEKMHDIYIDFIDDLAENVHNYAIKNNIKINNNIISLDYARSLVWGSLQGEKVSSNNPQQTQANIISNNELQNNSNGTQTKSCN